MNKSLPFIWIFIFLPDVVSSQETMILDRPVIIYEQIDISSPATVKIIKGDASIKIKKGDKYSFEDLKVNDTINFKDVLILAKNTIVKIDDNGKSLKLRTREKVKSFIFEEKRD